MKYKNIKLGEAAEITMGQSPKSIYYNKEGRGIPFIQGVSTFEDNYPRIETYTTKYNKKAQKGDLLFSVRAPVGRVNVANQTIAIGRGLASLKVKKGYSKSYIYYLFKKIGNQLDSIGSGTVFSSINKKELINLKIRVPEKLYDQCKIADRLRKIDEEIEINNQINDNLFELAKIFFDYVKTSTTKKFSDIVSIQNGFAFKSKNYVKDKQLVILRTKNINSNNLFKSKDVVYIPYSLKDQYSRFAFKKFDSVLVMIGSNIGKTGFVTSNNLPSLQNQNMWRFRSTNKNISGLLIYEYVNFINNKVKNSAVGSARAFYKKELFADYPVPIIKKDNNFVFKKLELEINNICKETDTLLLLKELLLNIYF